jgi:hypothetical protein
MRKERVTFQCSKAVREELNILAEKNKRTVSQVLQLIIDEYFAMKKRKELEKRGYYKGPGTTTVPQP